MTAYYAKCDFKAGHTMVNKDWALLFMELMCQLEERGYK